MNYTEFCILAEVAENKDEIIEQIRELERPRVCCDVETPTDLNKLTLGEYLALSTMDINNAISQAAKIVLKVDDVAIAQERADIILGFANFIGKELERIAKLFATTKVPPTEDEKKAGVDKMEFGAFGLIDWFALRMSIDHDKAENTPWLRVYKCLDIDAQKQRYERRLRDIINKKNKPKK